MIFSISVNSGMIRNDSSSFFITQKVGKVNKKEGEKADTEIGIWFKDFGVPPSFNYWP